MADHDEILRRQREKMEEHRRWLAQQQESLQQMGTGGFPSPTQQHHQQHDRASAGYETDRSRMETPHQVGSARGQAAFGQRFGAAAASPSYGGAAADSAPGSPDYADSRGQPMTARTVGSPLNVHVRSTQWARRRAQKLEELKALQQSENAQDCPFAPEVHDVMRYDSAGRARTVAVNGADKFLARQNAARTMKEERVLKIKCDGSKWRNETTVPEEFALGTLRNRQPIGSLRQPLKAPSTRTPQDHLRAMLHDPRGVDAFDAAADVVPRGAFSSKSSTAIIDVATRRGASP